jgi:hypothetical protein
MQELKKGEMLVIPLQVNKDEYDLFLIMKPANISRIEKYDPCIIPTEAVDKVFPRDELKLRNLVMAYATDEEIKKIILDRQLGVGIGPTLKMLSKGWQHLPEDGDGGDVTQILPPGRG